MLDPLWHAHLARDSRAGRPCHSLPNPTAVGRGGGRRRAANLITPHVTPWKVIRCFFAAAGLVLQSRKARFGQRRNEHCNLNAA